MKVFKIETRYGWFSRPERISCMNFPASSTASIYGATVYLTKTCARRDVKKFKLKNCNICEFEEKRLENFLSSDNIIPR